MMTRELGWLAACAVLLAACSSSSGPEGTGAAFACPSSSPAVKSACNDCVASACDANAQAAFGPAWASAQFTGPCAAQAICSARCACDDKACVASCVHTNGTTACAAAEASLGECTDRNCAACATGGGPLVDAGVD